MIIFDYNQVAISNLMQQIGSSKGPVDESLVRHMILNTIRTYVKKFKESHGPEIVIACDNKNYWRREIFKHYKAGRRKARDSSGHDWNSIFECLNKIRDELKQFSPYKVIDVETCEADDIIACICEYSSDDILIIAGDKDYLQLHTRSNIKQYDPVNKRFLKTDCPKTFLHEHIIRGDQSDGVPNIASPDNCFVVGERQKKITKKLMEQCKLIDFDMEHPLRRNYIRNKNLIDLSMIPIDLKQKVIEEYNNTPASHAKRTTREERTRFLFLVNSRQDVSSVQTS